MIHPKESVDFRSYRNIFSDNNQMNPKDEIKLGYESNVKSIEFLAGKDTYFHFPLLPSAYVGESGYENGLSIHDSSMINDGAICGSAPYCSDRVLVHNADYEWKDMWGNYKSEKVGQNGEWLCAWLSGDMEHPEDAVWMDRWYDPSAMTEDEANSADSSDVVDIPSELKFVHGCQYCYHRMGNESVKSIVDNIDATSGLIVHIDEWSISGCPNTAPKTKDILFTTNNDCYDGMFYSCSVNKNRENDYGVKFEGRSSVMVNRDNIISPKDGPFTVVAMIRNDDWANSMGYGMIDMGYHGGWQLSCSPRAKNNIIMFCGQNADEKKSIAIYGTNYRMLSTRTLDVGEEVDETILAMDIDDEYYMWGCMKDRIVKTDLNGNFINDTSYDGRFETHQVAKIQILGNEFDGDDYYGKAFVCDKNGNGYLYNMVTMKFEREAHSSEFSGRNSILLSKYSFIECEYDGKARVYDCRNVLDLEGEGSVKKVVVSCDGSIYVLTDTKIVRYIRDKDTKFIKRENKQHEDRSTPYGMFMTTKEFNGKIIDVVNLVYESGKVITYNKNLKRMDTYNIGKTCNFITNAESNYDWGRRFCNACLYTRITIGTEEELNYSGGRKILLQIPLSEVSNYDWHQLALVRDNDGIYFVFDGKIKDSYVFTDADKNTPYIMSVGKPSIVIGGECGFGTELADEHPVYNCFWNGMVDDFRLYSEALTIEDLNYIHLLKYDVDNLSWNMEIANKYYIEAVKRVYKMKMPGAKTANYQIRVDGYKTVDGGDFEAVTGKMRGIIENVLPNVTPAYTENSRILFNGGK